MEVDEHSLEILDKIGGKILEGPLFFKSPQEETKSVISCRNKVLLMGKERTLDAGLEKATLLVSSDLVGAHTNLQLYSCWEQISK